MREFYQLRFARIAPLLFLLLVVLSGLHLAHVKGFVVTEKTGGLGRALFAALTFHVNLLEARREYLPPKLGHSLVAVGGGDVLSFLSLVCRLFRSRQVPAGPLHFLLWGLSHDRVRSITTRFGASIRILAEWMRLRWVV